MESTYILDKEHEAARRRLSRVQEVEDPATIEALVEIGVSSGWQCLEVGAGAGSIAAWLCRRVGPAGRVLATDVDVRFLRELDFPNLEIREHDVARDPLLPKSYDLVHVRNLLVHLPSREAVLRTLAACVRPTGWILIEEPDVVTDAPDPGVAETLQSLYRRVLREIHVLLEESGVDLGFGSRVFGLLRSLGFEGVTSEGRLRMYRGGVPEDLSPHALAYVQLRDAVVTSGRVSDQEYDDFLRLFDSASFAWRDGLRVATRGRRPRI